MEQIHLGCSTNQHIPFHIGSEKSHSCQTWIERCCPLLDHMQLKANQKVHELGLLFNIAIAWLEWVEQLLKPRQRFG